MNVIASAYERFCKKRFPLPTEEQVVDLEKRIGVALPPDYRRFILEFNGGFFTEPSIDPPCDKCPSDRLTVLDGIGASHTSAELGSYIDLFDDNYPCIILPIGYTLMGNLLFVYTSLEDNGCVCLKKASLQDLAPDQVFLLGEEMVEFFTRLREPEPEPE